MKMKSKNAGRRSEVGERGGEEGVVGEVRFGRSGQGAEWREPTQGSQPTDENPFVRHSVQNLDGQSNQ